MELFMQILCIIFMAVIGGLPTLYMVVSMPVILVWKIYRKFKYHISIYD